MSGGSARRAQRVYELVRDLVPTGREVLEVSCGEAETLARLRQAGYRVRGTNFTRYPNAPPDVPIEAGVDLLAGLPFPDGAFDAVILTDVIEHLCDHRRALAELARVARPGGVVIVVTPNTLKLSSRLHFLATGFFKVKRAFIGFDVPNDRAFAFHNYPPHLPTFLYLAASHGLAATSLDAVGYKFKSVLLWLLLSPIVLPATWAKVHLFERHLRGTPAAAMLYRALTSRPALCGESLVMVFVRVADDSLAVVDQMERRTSLPRWSEPEPSAGPGQLS
ncbi:MAG: class I SAM-dependent methyltransferase [Planctomycetes bacterium]|nr:class I SAM-dependent methyltransferase [Planctomycetota bacterium]